MKNDKITEAVIFLLPMFGLPTKVYQDAGLVGVYTNDDQKCYIDPVIVLVFKADEYLTERIEDIITLLDDQVIEVYSPHEQLLGVTLEIPEIFLEDYYKVLHSQYSHLSSIYKELVSGPPENDKMKLGMRLPYMIIEKHPVLQKLTINKKGDMGLEDRDEVWKDYSEETNTLTQEIIETLIL